MSGDMPLKIFLLGLILGVVIGAGATSTGLLLARHVSVEWRQ